MRLLPAGANALLVELDDLAQTLSLLATLRASPIEGLGEIVPGARTLLIEIDPLRWSLDTLATELARRPLDQGIGEAGERIEIPVHYDGEDLAEVATLLEITPEEVVRRHTGSEWFVAFTGFAPGFAYLSGGDELLQRVPRRKSPRTRIPPGAVAVAGGFSGVYPKASPGGWQILGQTMVAMWDLNRDPPALLQPGQRVRFVNAGPSPLSRERERAGVREPQQAHNTHPHPNPLPRAGEGVHAIEVRNPGLQALLQDLGRPGLAGQGISASGAMDRGSLRSANRLVGNPIDTACIELAAGGFELVSRGDNVVAVSGAEGPLTLTTADNRTWPLSRHAPLALADGDRLRVGEPRTGIRSYLAVRGGFDRAPVLGSLSFDSLAEVGPSPLVANERLAVHPLAHGASVGLPELVPPAWPTATDIVTLDVLLGPRADWFTPEALACFGSQTWTVTPQSSRVGVRVHGEQPLTRAITSELPSEGTVLGAIQVPASGQPVIFLADHPLTGGYPVIACIAPWHLDLAGQLPIGTRIRFNALSPPSARFHPASQT